MSVKFIDYYKVLGVDRKATPEEVRRAYRALTKKYHPDINKSPDADQKFKEINEAYEVLRDPEKRKRYDALGPNWRHGAEFSPPPDWEQMFRRSTAGGSGGGFRFEDLRGGGFQGMEDLSDFFGTLFGDMFGGGGARTAGSRGGQRTWSWGGNAPGGGARGGRDVESSLPLTLEEAYAGGKKNLSVYPHGNGSSPRTIKVTIPKGAMDGTRLRLAGQGEAGADGSTGDLFLVVKHRPHPTFRLEGQDVHVNLPLAPWEAVLGAKVEVPTLDGPIRMTIRKGSQNGQRLRLRGKGWPVGGRRGDQLVTLDVQVPTETGSEEMALWRRLAETSTYNPRAHFPHRS